MLLLVALVGFCVYWVLPAEENDELGIVIALSALCAFGLASGWKAPDSGRFRPIGRSVRFAFRASVVWTTTACFAEYIMTDLTVTLTLLQFPSWVILGGLAAMSTHLVGYLARTVARVGLSDPQIWRDIGQVVGLILAAVALVVGLNNVPREGERQDKQHGDLEHNSVLSPARAVSQDE